MKAFHLGYARVSSYGQSLDVQLEKLNAAGIDRLYQEKISGRSGSKLAEREAMLANLRPGDTVVVTRLDRLGRSLVDLAKIAERLKQNEVNLIVLDQSIDTTTAMGRYIYNQIAAFAEFELDMIKERAQAGRDLARRRGVKFGRRSKLTRAQKDDLVAAFNRHDEPREELMRRFGISKATLYRLTAGASKGSIPQAM